MMAPAGVVACIRLIEDIVRALRSDRIRFDVEALPFDEIGVGHGAYSILMELLDLWRHYGEPVHSVWAYNREPEFAVLITTYRPDPDRWIDWRTRRVK